MVSGVEGAKVSPASRRMFEKSEPPSTRARFDVIRERAIGKSRSRSFPLAFLAGKCELTECEMSHHRTVISAYPLGDTGIPRLDYAFSYAYPCSRTGSTMDAFKARVSGETLKENVGKEVVLVCKIVSNDGSSAQAQASDGHIVGLTSNGYITEASFS